MKVAERNSQSDTRARLRIQYRLLSGYIKKPSFYENEIMQSQWFIQELSKHLLQRAGCVQWGFYK